MRIESLSLSNVRYNPEQGAFEAAASIREKGDSYSYPVQVKAPLNADFGFITRRLSETARQMHRHAPSRGLRLKRAPVPSDAGPSPTPAPDGFIERRQSGAALAA